MKLELFKKLATRGSTRSSLEKGLARKELVKSRAGAKVIFIGRIAKIVVVVMVIMVGASSRGSSNSSKQRVAPNLEFQETEEETGSEPDGETAKVLGPKDDMSSGLGGLGLDGMVGSDDSVGESSSPPGEGNRGVMSGDRAGEGEDNGDDDDGGGGGSDAGAAEIVFDADDNWEEYEKDKMHKAISMLSAIK
ncbi:hypothetical protein R6Q57_004362 [Mikania cordata]